MAAAAGNLHRRDRASSSSSTLLDPAQWLSLGISLGIVAAGFVYFALYLRPRTTTHLLLLIAADDEEDLLMLDLL